MLLLQVPGLINRVCGLYARVIIENDCVFMTGVCVPFDTDNFAVIFANINMSHQQHQSHLNLDGVSCRIPVHDR